VVPRVTRASVKKVPISRNPKRSKKAKETEVSLEAHESVASPHDVSNFSCTHSPCTHLRPYILCSLRLC
jgi:hypothetical protein